MLEFILDEGRYNACAISTINSKKSPEKGFHSNMNNNILQNRLYSLLRCPRCGAAHQPRFEDGESVCTRCNLTHFQLGEVPCFFPSGSEHKLIWQFQAGVMHKTATHGLESIAESLSRYDLSNATRARLEGIFRSCELSQVNTFKLLEEYGITPLVNEQVNQMNIGDLSEYYDLVLRDWAWDTTANPSAENQIALNRVLSQINSLDIKPKKILVLGAGAGRLSWDIHTTLKPELTVALDSHPFMLSISNWLIRQQQPIALGEFKIFPQIELPSGKIHTLTPPADPENLRERWFGLGGNIWNMPVLPESFDMVISPWLVDVTGGDVRDLIGIISQVLCPGGHWINTGPLLFTRHIPVQIKYNAPEIKEFLTLSGFDLAAEDVQVSNHLVSPIEARGRTEQIWTFTAHKSATATERKVDGVAAAWLVMHHLPVPTLNYSTKDKHPLIGTILALVDGIRSINDICTAIADRIPEGIAVKDAVVTLLGQSLAEQGNTQEAMCDSM